MAAASSRRLTRRKIIGLAIPLAVVAALALLIPLIRRSAPPDINQAFPRGELVVGVDASFPPFALDDGETIRGLDIDLASAISDELKVPIRFVNIGFYALHDALISGQVDILVSALRVDPARMEDLRYTRPYFDNGLVVVGMTGGTETDIEPPARARIAYEYASSAESQIHAWEEDGQWITMLPYELPEYALDALRLGLADGAVMDAITLRLYQSEHDNWRSRYEYITHEPFAIAVRIDRVAAWRLVDGALETLIESGALARIIDRWL